MLWLKARRPIDLSENKSDEKGRSTAVCFPSPFRGRTAANSGGADARHSRRLLNGGTSLLLLTKRLHAALQSHPCGIIPSRNRNAITRFGCFTEHCGINKRCCVPRLLAPLTPLQSNIFRLPELFWHAEKLRCFIFLCAPAARRCVGKAPAADSRFSAALAFYRPAARGLPSPCSFQGSSSGQRAGA